MKFETIIGLEVHVELKTDSKILPSSPNKYGNETNENINPKDLGHPGTLPVLNKEAANYGMKASMALKCAIADETVFDRKHYFYPDNSAAYQISQDEQPIGEHGWIAIEVDGKRKKIGMERLHLEEDAGQLTHT